MNSAFEDRRSVNIDYQISRRRTVSIARNTITAQQMLLGGLSIAAAVTDAQLNIERQRSAML
jgi:hypothetical protein